ncbi:glutamic acid-rich protein-like isoform X2 [Cavia porcellus]
MRQQEERLLQVDTRAELCSVQAEEHKNIVHNMEEQQEMIEAFGLQNCLIKEQLAQMQDSFQRLREENTNIVTTLSSEQLRNKEVTWKLGQLQEEITQLKAVVALKSQEAQELQQQRDQLLGILCHRAEDCLHLASEKHALQHQLLQSFKQAVNVHLKDLEDHKALVSLYEDLKTTQEVLSASKLQKQQTSSPEVVALPGEGEVEERKLESPQPNSTSPEDARGSKAAVSQEKAEIKEAVEELECQRMLLSAEHTAICPKLGTNLTVRHCEEEDTQQEEEEEQVKEEEEGVEEEEDKHMHEKEEGNEQVEEDGQEKEEDKRMEDDKKEQEKHEEEKEEVDKHVEEEEEQKKQENEEEDGVEDEEYWNQEGEEEVELVGVEEKEEGEEKEEEELEGEEEVEMEEEEQEEEQEVEEEENKEQEEEEEQQEEDEHTPQLFSVKGEEQEVVLCPQEDCRSCQGEFQGSAQSHGEEPTVGSPHSKDVAASDEQCGPAEGSPAHTEQPPVEEAVVKCPPEPQLLENENLHRALAWAFTPESVISALEQH